MFCCGGHLGWPINTEVATLGAVMNIYQGLSKPYFTEIYNKSIRGNSTRKHNQNRQNNTFDLIVCVLTPLSAIFKLYHDDQF
jgi:hypothetical protein